MIPPSSEDEDLDFGPVCCCMAALADLDSFAVCCILCICLRTSFEQMVWHVGGKILVCTGDEVPDLRQEHCCTVFHFGSFVVCCTLYTWLSVGKRSEMGPPQAEDKLSGWRMIFCCLTWFDLDNLTAYNKQFQFKSDKTMNFFQYLWTTARAFGL